MASLDLFIVNIAFPDLARSFDDASLTSLSWVLNAYAIVFAALLVPAGRIADRVGRKRVFIAGLLTFSAASALCALSPSIPFLVGARVLQAVGGAMMLPTTLGLILPAFPPEQRAARDRHLVGGRRRRRRARPADRRPPRPAQLALDLPRQRADRPGHRAASPGASCDEVREPEDGRPDLLGAAELALGIGLLTLGIVKGPDWGWTDPRDLASFAAAVAPRRRLPLPLRPPPRAGDRAAAAARALLRPRQPRRRWSSSPASARCCSPASCC